jgi:hypothetical protein
MTTSALPPPRSSREWLAYFEINAHRLLPLPWEQGPSPTAEELAAIASSLQQFQLGESSEGQWLLRAAAEYAEQTGDPDYLPAIQLFIAEEQRHARDLGCYLTAAGVPLLGWNWVDGIFRRLRRAAPLEQVLVVLLTAEMIAKVYYRAIHQATGCPLLRSLCAQLLRDEVRHGLGDLPASRALCGDLPGGLAHPRLGLSGGRLWVCSLLAGGLARVCPGGSSHGPGACGSVWPDAQAVGVFPGTRRFVRGDWPGGADFLAE